MNVKARDEAVIPLCHLHHFVEYHGINRRKQYWETNTAPMSIT
ncbi:hypothetical protein [Bradyrhizobium sp. STM 3557]